MTKVFYFVYLPLIVLITSAVSIISFFIYEELSDLYRYSEFGISLTGDDYYQSNILRRPQTTPYTLKKVLGKKVALTFAHLDRDGNGLISAVELEPLLHQIRQDYNHKVYEILPSCPDKSCVHMSVQVGHFDFKHASFVNADQMPKTVRKTFCEESSETKNCTDEAKNLEKHLQALNDQSRLISHRHFPSLMPRMPNAQVGQPYPIIDPLPSADEFFRSVLSIRFDPYVEPHERSLAVILNHFHDGYVSLYPSTPPHFSFGVIRAMNDKFIDFTLRLHVEFCGSDKSPYVVAPSALMGRLVIRKADRQVVHFELEQESDYVRFLSAKAGGKLMGVARLSQLRMASIERPVDISTISWTEAISPREAADILHAEMYNLNRDLFLPLPDFLPRLDEGKIESRPRPIFLVVSVGRLTDQTCYWGCVGFREILSSRKVTLKLQYEFNFLLSDIREVEELLAAAKPASASERLLRHVRDSLNTTVSLFALTWDGAELLAKTNHSQLQMEGEERFHAASNATRSEEDDEETLADQVESQPPGIEQKSVDDRLKDEIFVSYLNFLDSALDVIDRKRRQATNV